MQLPATLQNDPFKTWSMVLLVAYIGWLLLLSIRSSRRPKGDPADFFLAGKSVGRIPSLLSFWATYFSAAAVIGAAGYFYIHGIGNLIFSCSAYTIMGISTATVGKKLWREARSFPHLHSPIQLFLRSYHSPLLEWCAVLITLVLLVPYLAAQITGLSRLMEGAFNLPYFLSASGALAIIYLYSETGGLKNIIKSDVVQALMTLIGIFSVAAILLYRHWRFNLIEFLRDVDKVSEPSLLSLPGPTGLYTVSTLLAISLFLSLGTLGMPHMAKRYIIVNDQSTLTMMAWIFPFMGFALILVSGTVGLGGAVQFPGLTGGDTIIGRVAATAPGILGAMALVGIIAATMSTADSLLLTFGFIVTEQVHRGQHQRETGRIYRFNKWFTLAVAILAYAGSVKPLALVADLAFISFSAITQLVPVFLAGLYELKLRVGFALCSIASGIGTLVLLHKFPEILPPSYRLHPFLWAFSLATLFVLIGVVHGKLSAGSTVKSASLQ